MQTEAAEKQNEIHYAPPKNHGFDVSFVTESKVPTWDPMITPQKLGDVNGSLIEGEAFGTYYWSESRNARNRKS